MIIGRYLNKEVLKTMLVVLLVLLMLFVGQRFVYFLSGAAQGNFASELVLTLLFLQIPVFISYLLPLSLFLATLITVGKLYTDNEMTIISACGINKVQILLYFAPLIIALSLLTAYLTLFQAPVALASQQQLITEQENKGNLSLITPGRFQQTSDGKIIYVEKIADDAQMQRIFFVQQDDTADYKFSLIVAEQGRYWTDENQQNYIVLENGNQYQGSPGDNRLQSMIFERYFMEIKATTKPAVNRLQARSSAELFANKTMENQAELEWRIAAPVSVPLLLLLALPLARVAPRQGKFAQLLPGLMVYIIYMILLLTVRNAIAEEKMSPELGTWWVHLLLFIYGLFKFNQWNLKNILKFPKKPQTPVKTVT